jgi:hypothetical protein
MGMDHRQAALISVWFFAVPGMGIELTSFEWSGTFRFKTTMDRCWSDVGKVSHAASQSGSSSEPNRRRAPAGAIRRQT